MRNTTLVVTVAVVAALLFAVPAMGLAAVTDDTTETQQNETEAADVSAETAPGERLAGVVGVGEAELDGELDKRGFGLQVANASSEQAQADVVADRLVDVEQRLDELEQRKADLDQQREAGEISQGKYNAEVARLAAQTETVKQLSNQSAGYAQQIDPAIFEERLSERNVDVDAIQTLSERANELGGPEVAEIARGIAGPNVGQTPADDRPVDIPDRPDRPGPDRPGADNTTEDDRQTDRP